MLRSGSVRLEHVRSQESFTPPAPKDQGAHDLPEMKPVGELVCDFDDGAPPDPSEAKLLGVDPGEIDAGTAAKNASAQAPLPPMVLPPPKPASDVNSGASGAVFGGVAGPSAAMSPRQRAEHALSEVQKPDNDHPMMQYSREVRDELWKRGLPTNAQGVRIDVLGETGGLSQGGDPRDAAHPNQIVRSIGGPAGLGQQADIRVQDPSIRQQYPELSSEEGLARIKRNFAVRSGQASLSDAKEYAVDELERVQYQAKNELDEAVDRKNPSDPTSLATLSWGKTPFRLALELSDRAVKAGNDSPVVQDVNAAREKRGEHALDVTKPKDVAMLRGELMTAINAELQTPEAKQRLDHARSELKKSAENARAHGILPIAAAGNEAMRGMPEDWAPAKSVLADLPGFLTVGAGDIKAPATASDDATANFSNPGSDLLAPGVGLPVGPPMTPGGTPTDAAGTSFAAPWAAGVAALMIKAHPKISPDQIESYLLETAKPLPGLRDGHGMIDPVAAIERARGLGVHAVTVE